MAGTALTFGSNTIYPISDAGTTTVAAGIYYAINPIGEPPKEGDAESEEIPVAFAGVDGTGTKNLGFRGRDIYIELVFVATSKTNARSSKNTIVTNLKANRFSVTIPGSSARPSCKLIQGGVVDLKEFTLNGKHCLMCGFKVRQMGTS